MDIMKVSAVSMIGLVALLVLKQFRPEWSALIRLGILVVVFGFLLSMITTILNFANDIGGEDSLLPNGMWQLLLKALGITLVTEVAAGICKDSGEASMAQWVETAGKLEILVLSLPMIAEILTMIKTLLRI